MASLLSEPLPWTFWRICKKALWSLVLVDYKYHIMYISCMLSEKGWKRCCWARLSVDSIWLNRKEKYRNAQLYSDMWFDCGFCESLVRSLSTKELAFFCPGTSTVKGDATPNCRGQGEIAEHQGFLYVPIICDVVSLFMRSPKPCFIDKWWFRCAILKNLSYPLAKM